MGRTLDIDLYKDGFSVDSVDCIHGPIAAAAGYYSYEFYFYYNFLHCILIQASIKEKMQLHEYATNILDIMGLALEKINCTDISDEEAIAYISKIILDGMPVVLLTKYNALFYSMWYKVYSFSMNHAIIINEYLDDKKVFGIKETTLLRGIIDAYKNSDLLFSLHITDKMLYDIWMMSNKQFFRENSSFFKQFFVLKQGNHGAVNSQMILTQAVKLFNNWNNELINIIDDYDKRDYFNKSDQDIYSLIENIRQRFCGSLKPIYDLLYSCFDKDLAKRQMISEAEQQQTEIRKGVISTLHTAILRGQVLSEKKKQGIKAMVTATDNKMIDLIKSFAAEKTEQKMEYHYIDISGIYNNQAFASCISDNSVAALTHNEIHYIFDNNICCNTVWNQGNYSFIYTYNAGQADNIACEGQTIVVDNIEAAGISLLACAEYGDFKVSLNLEFKNGEKTDILTCFSDFYVPPKYGEKIFWTGVAARKQNGVTSKFPFSARLLAKTYKFEKNKVGKIKLPVCKNAHIFAITLIDE